MSSGDRSNLRAKIAFVALLALTVASLGQAASGQSLPPPTADVDHTIYLKTRLLEDPGVDTSFLAGIAASAAPLHGILQLHTLPKAGDLRRLAANGITPLAYLNGVEAPGTAYLASFSPSLNPADPAFGELVRAVQRLLPDDRKSLELANLAPGDPALVQFFSDVSAAAARTLLADAGLEGRPLGDSGVWEVAANSDDIQKLAERDEVQWIDVTTPPLELLDEVRAASNIDPVHQLNTNNGVYSGVSGLGVDIGIMDSGVDTAHNDFAGRMIRSQDDSGDHGSHVAGIAAGSGFQSDKLDDANVPNGGTPFQWRGVSPQADIAAYGFAGGDPSTFDDAINNFGVDVSNHSYVVNGTQGIYNSNAQAIDDIVRGDSPGVPARPAVWAAANNASVSARDCDQDGNNDGNFPQYPFPGNPGPCPTAFQAGYFSVLTPCKNCVTVGNLTKGLVHAGSSSMGPTMDGRLKPDVSAIGSGVTSVGADTDRNGNPVVGNGYRNKGGTSMSAPAVTGTVGLMLEQYASTFGANLDTAPLLPSTSKAILVQTAIDQVGVDNTANFDTGNPVTYGAGPDWATGYGLVDGQAAVEVVADKEFLEDEVGESDVTDDHLASVQPGQAELRITLAWDDLSGTPNANDAAPTLVNDLDLTLHGPNGEVHRPLVLPTLTPNDCDGNVNNGVQVGTCIGPDPFQNYFGPAAEGTDRRNNVEQVVIPNPAPGEWTARVSVLNADGVTIRLPLGGSQPYSLAGISTARADLSIDKTDSPDPVNAGGDLTYQVTVTNNGPDPALNVTVVDTLPPGVTHVSNTDSCVEGPVGTLTCSLGDAPLGPTSFNITVKVDPALVMNNGGPLSIENKASVASSTVDDDPSNNETSEQTQVIASADLKLGKSCSPDPVAPGGILTCILEVANLGPSVAENLVVTDNLPENVQLQGAPSGGGFNCVTQEPDPEITCTKASQQASVTAEITYSVFVSEDAEPGSSLINTAAVTSSTTDPDPNNNGEAETTSLPTCTITGTNASETLTGTAGNDVICALGGSDKVDGLGGDDIVIGGAGQDKLTGGAGNDTLIGGAGDDTLAGAAGDDRLFGGLGNDSISGGTGADLMFGREGNDSIEGNADLDSADGGPETDSCEAETVLNCE